MIKTDFCQIAVVFLPRLILYLFMGLKSIHIADILIWVMQEVEEK